MRNTSITHPLKRVGLFNPKVNISSFTTAVRQIDICLVWMACSVQMFENNITRSIEVCIKLKTALFTFERGLALPVTSCDMSALAASLRCVAGVHIFNIAALCQSLVCKELLKLKKVPLVNLLPLCFSQGFLAFLSFLGVEFPRAATDSGKFLKNNRRTRLRPPNYLLRNTVVDVLPHKPFAPFDLLQVCPCGASLFALQLASQPLVSFAQSLYPASAEKPVVARDRNVPYSTVNPDKIAGWFHILNLPLKDDVQEGLSLALKKVGGTSFPRKVLFKIFGHEYRKPDPSINGQNVDGVGFEINGQAPVIVPYGTTLALWTRNLLSLLLSRNDGSQSLRSLDPCGDNKLGLEFGFLPQTLVGKVVQTDSVVLLLVPSGIAYLVESVRVCFKRWLEHAVFNLQLYFNGSYLFHIPLVYMQTV